LIVKDTGLVDEVESFDDPESAAEYLRCIANHNPEDFPDIILLDLGMPVMDGWECLEQFSQFPSVFTTCRIMVLSSSIAPADIDRSRNYRMVSGFMPKPLDREKIRDYFENYCTE
jgi:CheY-like chemotaxis protein